LPKEKLMEDHTNGPLPSHEYKAYDVAPDAGRLEELANLTSARTPNGINRSMALVRTAWDLGVALVSKFAQDRREFRALGGNARFFEWQESGGVPLDGTICKRVVDGRAEGSLKNAERRYSALLSVAPAMSHRLAEESRIAEAFTIGIWVVEDCV
jgi:hypothetical protein